MTLVERHSSNLNHNDLNEEYNVGCFQLERFKPMEIRELYHDLTMKW